MDPLAFLHARRSTPSRLLGEPAPDDAQLLRLLEAAVRVPDHGKLVPFRFLRLKLAEGDEAQSSCYDHQQSDLYSLAH